MRRVLGLLAVVALSGCPSLGTHCETEADCASMGGTCDTDFHVCVLRDGSDGGTGGGVATGGGTGGGTAMCPTTCTDGTSCPAGGTECKALTVALVAPMDNGHASGLSMVTLRATVTDAAGAAWSGNSVPVTVPAGVTGPATLTKQGTEFTGAFTMPNVAGAKTFHVGWTGAEATVTVLVDVCMAMCQPWEECVANADGGTCADLGLTLSWTTPTPAEGSKVRPSTMVSLALAVTRADGGAFNKPVPFTVDGADAGDLLPQLGAWTGSVTSATSSVQTTLSAGWANGPAQPIRHFQVDATPPVLGLVVPGTAPYQRDAVVYAELTSNEPIADAGVSLAGVAMPQVSNALCSGLGAVDGGVGCYQLDFSQPVLNGLDGGFAVLLGGVDDYANVALTPGEVLPVTRVRWTATPNGHTVQALAIGSDGTLYVGTSTNGTELLSLNSSTGSTVHSISPGDVQSIAVDPSASGDVVFIGYNSATGNVGAVAGATLGPQTLGPCQGSSSSKTYSGIALYKAGAVTTAIAAMNAGVGNSKGCLYDVVNGASNIIGPGLLDAAPVPNKVDVATNVVVSGATASFLRQDSSGSPGIYFQSVALTASPSAGTQTRLTTLVGVPAAGQAVSSGQFLIGTGDTGNGSQMYSVTDGGVQVGGSLGMTSEKGTPSIASSSEAYVGEGSTFVRFNPSALATSTNISGAPNDLIRTAPVLGAPRKAGATAEGYAVSRGGTLLVFPQGTGTAALWAAPLLPGDTVLTHMAFDCNRSAPTSKTGVLYIGAASGKVLSIIVDSPKLLDTAGAWPKYQRSMGNAGNDDTANFPTNWPSCP